MHSIGGDYESMITCFWRDTSKNATEFIGRNMDSELINRRLFLINKYSDSEKKELSEFILINMDEVLYLSMENLK